MIPEYISRLSRDSEQSPEPLLSLLFPSAATLTPSTNQLRRTVHRRTPVAILRWGRSGAGDINVGKGDTALGRSAISRRREAEVISGFWEGK